jgi:acylphosphatase
MLKGVNVLIASMRSSTNLGIAGLIKNNPDGRAVSILHAGVIDGV